MFSIFDFLFIKKILSNKFIILFFSLIIDNIPNLFSFKSGPLENNLKGSFFFFPQFDYYVFYKRVDVY